MRHRILALALGLGFCGCAAHSERSAISVPAHPIARALTSQRIADGLNNPRGMLASPDGRLLVALAGTGRGNSGSIVEAYDANGDGRFSANERKVILADQPSANALEIVRRDEVFGPAAIAAGAGQQLATIAFFGGPSHVVELNKQPIAEWSRAHGNLNSIAYDPTRRAWFAVSSTSDEVVRLRPGLGPDRLIKIPPLANGQDPVPGYIRFDPNSELLLVSLFSGSVVGEEGGIGTELVAGSGAVIALDPDTQETTTVIAGLTAPTDIEIDDCGGIFVLELCSDFVDPVATSRELEQLSHGGFRRFSGRLLHATSSAVSVVASGLDAPTNLARSGNSLFVAGGMGTPGRMIPGPNGPQALQGYIDRIDIPKDWCEPTR